VGPSEWLTRSVMPLDPRGKLGLLSSALQQDGEYFSRQGSGFS
jgi:hypothetical protein